MMRNRFFLLVVALCMTIGMGAQVNSGNTTEVKPDEESVKKEAEENYQKGNKFWKAKEVDKALTYYGLAAEAGHPEAQYIMGLLCIEGKKVMKNIDLGIEWLEKAGMQGHKDAQFKLAAIFLQGEIVEKDLQMAQFWARKYKGLPDE